MVKWKNQIPNSFSLSLGLQLGLVAHTPEKHSPPPEAPATLLGSHPQLLWHQGRRSYEDLMPDI